LEILHGEDYEVALKLEGPAKEASPTVIHELIFELRDIEFKKPGTYFIRFLGNDQTVIERPFIVQGLDQPKEEPHE
jgi:hypothetical protein